MSNIKHRPTFTTNELKLIASCITERLGKHIQAGDFNNPILLNLHKLKEYCESFADSQAKPTTDAERLAAYLQSQVTASTVNSANAVSVAALNNDIQNSVLENSELSDEQKFDLLSLRDSSTYTEKETIFMLNTGTMIKLRRASAKPVNANEL